MASLGFPIRRNALSQLIRIDRLLFQLLEGVLVIIDLFIDSLYLRSGAGADRQTRLLVACKWPVVIELAVFLLAELALSVLHGAI
jgi:hypothetical protein